MSELPLVSLVTPSYNQGQFLEKTICSVLEQDYPNIEYLVFDGGSTDNSLEILQRHASRLAYWESQPDRGQAHAINKGLQRAQGTILGWLNSDDILLPGVVRRAVEIFQQSPQIDVVYGRLLRIDINGRQVPTPLLPKDRLVFSKQLVIGECLVNQPGSFWRRSIMEKAGVLDDKLRYVMDYEYWIRLALAGAHFWRVSDPVACFRLSPGSKTVGQTERMAAEQLQVLEALLSQPGLPADLGLTSRQVQSQGRTARSAIALHIFYGSLKAHHWQSAARWLGLVLRNDARVLFQPRWLSLWVAGLLRRAGFRIRDIIGRD